MTPILITDNALQSPAAYRAAALNREFMNFQQFKGIGLTNELPPVTIPDGLKITLTFFRKSPAGQTEPNFIHHDRGMGEWTGILYLNPDPPDGDGTLFWRHRATGQVAYCKEVDWEADGKDLTKWELEQHVPAAFNRLLLFPAPLFHSRAIMDNYGEGDSARLIQVMFGTGKWW